MTLELGPLIVDAGDPAAVTAFWSSALGSTACRRRLLVRAQRGPKTVKNRVHLDVYVRDAEDLLTLGATVLADYSPERITMADVEGNEFCAFIDPDGAGAATARVFAVCTDCAQPERLAAWWATQVGSEVRNGPDGTPRWLYGSAGWTDVIWKFVRVQDQRVAPNRWRWSVLDADATSPVPGVATSDASTFVDPDGNEFSVVRTRRPG